MPSRRQPQPAPQPPPPRPEPPQQTQPGTVPRKPNQRIVLLAKENPKRPGSKSFARFELYQHFNTTDEYLKNGGYAADLLWDADRGFIKLV